MSDVFPIENVLKQGDALPFLFNFPLEYIIKGPRKSSGTASE
jgi:hypothetical protein